MNNVAIERDSIEKLEVTVTTDVEPDITFAVEFAFMTEGVLPQSGDWHFGEIELTTIRGCTWTSDVLTPLIGQTPLDLAPGFYVVWIRINNGTEHAVLHVGTLTVL